MGRNSVSDPLEVEHVLEVSEGARHPESDVNTGSPAVKEEAAALVVGLALDLRPDKHTSPQVNTNQVSEKFQIVDVHGKEVIWDIASEELPVPKVDPAKARTTAHPAIGACVKSDVVFVAGEDERRYSVPVDQSVLPPLQVGLEAGVQGDGGDVVGSAQGVEHPVCVKAAGPNHFGTVHEAADDLLELQERSL